MNTPTTTSKKALRQQSNLSTAAHSINSKAPKHAKGEIEIIDNSARIILPSGVPVCVLTMMEIAQACLLYGCDSYVSSQMGTPDRLAITLYYSE
jgi:hypothetical protein